MIVLYILLGILFTRWIVLTVAGADGIITSGDLILINKESGEEYFFVRWNWYAVHGMTRNGDVVVKRIKRLHGNFFKEMSGEFHDHSELYINLEGEGIKPYPDSFV